MKITIDNSIEHKDSICLNCCHFHNRETNTNYFEYWCDKFELLDVLADAGKDYYVVSCSEHESKDYNHYLTPELKELVSIREELISNIKTTINYSLLISRMKLTLLKILDSNLSLDDDLRVGTLWLVQEVKNSGCRLEQDEVEKLVQLLKQSLMSSNKLIVKETERFLEDFLEV